MKVHQIYNESDFNKLTKLDLYNLWFRDAFTDGQIAKMYGVNKHKVKQLRKQYNLGYFSSAVLLITGPAKYRTKRTKEDRKGTR